MSNFIWVRDYEKNQHFINVSEITRVTKVPPLKSRQDYSYILLNDGKTINLSRTEFDTFDDVITKIQKAEA